MTLLPTNDSSFILKFYRGCLWGAVRNELIIVILQKSISLSETSEILSDVLVCKCVEIWRKTCGCNDVRGCQDGPAPNGNFHTFVSSFLTFLSSLASNQVCWAPFQFNSVFFRFQSALEISQLMWALEYLCNWNGLSCSTPFSLFFC